MSERVEGHAADHGTGERTGHKLGAELVVLGLLEEGGGEEHGLGIESRFRRTASVKPIPRSRSASGQVASALAQTAPASGK
jgi:hypothetical protein